MTNDLACTVKGTHTITITLKPEEARVVGDKSLEVWVGFYDTHCDFCGKDMAGASLPFATHMLAGA